MDETCVYTHNLPLKALDEASTAPGPTERSIVGCVLRAHNTSTSRVQGLTDHLKGIIQKLKSPESNNHIHSIQALNIVMLRAVRG